MAKTGHETPARHKQPGWNLDAPETMILAGEDRDAFVAAVLDPSVPTEKLLAALQKHRDLREGK